MPRRLYFILIGIMTLALLSSFCSARDEVRRVDKDTLKGWLGQPDVVVIDVRAPKDWAASDKKIAGAVRREPGDVANWGKMLPPGKKIVTYCA
jgi:rhodanese-related sulfurtransferase